MGVVVSLLLLVILPTQALAGGHATLSLGSNNTQMKIEWRNASTARFNIPAPGGRAGSVYTLLLNGKIYLVSNGRVMSGLAGMFSSHSGILGHPMLSGPIGSETIAGIHGSVYRVVWPTKSNNGEGRLGRFKDVVLTNNSLVREMTKVWIANATAMQNTQMRVSNALKDVFGNRGVLRAGNTMRVVSIDGRMPPASDFVLPKSRFPRLP